MSIFDKIFKRKSKKEQELDFAFEKVTKELQDIDNWDDPKKLEHYILDSCEQIIATTKEIKKESKEYKNVTKYLDDIQIIDNLPKDKANEVRSAAANILETERAKNAYLESAQRITDEQFVMMEQEEEDMPSTIKRMMDNEKYQAKIKKEMQDLEAQKTELEMDIGDCEVKQRRFLIITILVGVVFVSAIILSFAIEQFAKGGGSLFRIVFIALCGIAATALFLFMTNLSSEQKKYKKRLNNTISLLNMVRMKYVNVTKAVDYVKDKYEVENGMMLLYIWEQYLEAVKEKQRFEKNSDDFEYFTGRLMRLLKSVNLYDEKIWLIQTSALVDRSELIEIRHKLVTRRSKIRDRMEENTRIVKSERDEIDKLMADHHYYVPEIIEIINSVDKICGLNNKG